MAYNRFPNRFNFDMENIDSLEYMKRTILGGRQYCLKEPLSTLPKARMQLKAYVFLTLFLVLIFNIIIKIFFSMYALDRFCKFMLLGLFIWAIYKFTGAKQIMDGLMTDSLVFQKAN